MRQDSEDWNMQEEKIIIPYSDTISTVEQRKLLETTQLLKQFLTKEEFVSIMKVYLSVINRLEKEGE